MEYFIYTFSNGREITKGKRNIIINIMDQWDDSNSEVYNQEMGHGIYDGLEQEQEQGKDYSNYTGDLYMKVYKRENKNSLESNLVNNTADGNIIYYEVKEGNIYVGDIGQGQVNHLKIKQGHGGDVISAAIPKLNDKGIVGVAPNCMAILSSPYHNPVELDVNPSSDDYQRPDIISASFYEIKLSDKISSINKGIIFISGTSQCFYEGSNDFMHDIKPISVFDLYDCEKNSENSCVPFDYRINLSVQPGVKSDFNNSCDEGEYKAGQMIGNNLRFKLLQTNRIGKGSSPEVDVVAPGHIIFLAYNSSYRYPVYPAPSYAIPHVSATAALMKSVDIDLGCANSQGIVEVLADIHRKAYDIITFTAEKINTKFTDPHPANSYHEYREQKYNGEWVDPLKRWYAGGPGYGKVNAYRCVAQSIRHKGMPSYTQSVTLPFASNDGNQSNPHKSEGYVNSVDDGSKMLMHFGAFNEEGNPVLEDGGNKYTTNNDWDNCYGTTFLTNQNFNITLTVPNNSILANDGIIKQGEGTKINHVIKTTGSGKILSSGFIEDIELNGTLKLDDIEVHSTTDAGFGKLIFKKNGETSEDSEIYGDVKIFGNSKIIVESGTLILTPVTSIDLKGNNDLIVKDGAILEIMYGCKITGVEGRKIVVEPGGTLKVDEGALVHIDIDLDVQGQVGKKGNVIFEKNTLIYPKEYIINPNTDWQLAEGTVIIPTIVENEVTKSALITVRPDATFTINNPDVSAKPVALLGGVKVEGSCEIAFPVGKLIKTGKFIIEADSKVDIGTISSTYFSWIEIKEGAVIRLFGSFKNNQGQLKSNAHGSITNIIYGEFRINGIQSKRTSISGFQGVNPYQCGNETPNNFVFPTIRFNSTNGQMTFCGAPPNHLSIVKYTDFNNIIFKSLHRYHNQFENCTFTIDGNLLKSFDNDNLNFENIPINSIFEIQNAYEPIFVWHNFTNGTIGGHHYKDCKFKNTAFERPLLTTQFENHFSDMKYYFTAIDAQNTNGLIVDNSNIVDDQFEHFKYAIKTLNLIEVKIKNVKFNKCRIGVFDENSSVNLCNNTFNTVRVCSDFTNSKLWKIYNNTFEKVMYGVRVDNNSKLIFRSNYFNNFSSGIYNELGTSWLRGENNPNEDPENPNDNEFKWGRNKFNVINPEFFENSGENETNPFFDKLNENEYKPGQSDIWLNDKNSKLELRCGKNIFSQWSRHHLWSQVTSYNTSEWPTVFCKFNRFDNRERGEPDYKIRKPEEINRGINIDNDITPESIDFDDGQEIYINCEDPEEFETCEPVQIVCEYYPYNYGSLPESSEEVVDDMFWSAYNDFCSDMLNCECDRLRLEDAL